MACELFHIVMERKGKGQVDHTSRKYRSRKNGHYYFLACPNPVSGSTTDDIVITIGILAGTIIFGSTSFIRDIGLFP